MQIKNSTSSIGKLKKLIPVTYLGLKDQIFRSVKTMSQIIKNAATIRVAGQKKRKLRLNFNLG
jgi:hypothetical protein